MKNSLKLLLVLFLIILVIYNSEPLYCMDDKNEVIKDIIKDQDKSPSVQVNLSDAFKYIGAGAAAAGVGSGVAKIIKTLPPSGRVSALLIGTGITATAHVATEAINTIYNSPSKKKNISITGEINPTITAEGKVKIGEHTKINIESSNAPLTSPNSNVTDVTSPSSDSSQIPSMFENNFISNLIENDPYLVLIYCILFISLIGLYTLIALNIGYVIKNMDSLNKKISELNNPIIIKILNYYKKYNAALFWFWFLALYSIFIILIIISIVLIDQYSIINSPQ